MAFKYYLLRICGLLFSSLWIVSCEKELEFSYHDIAPLIVIEGELTPSGIRVGITYTTPMDEPMDRTHLTDATVMLEDITSGFSYMLSPDKEGYYTHDVGGECGHEYRLSIERDGCRYVAETMMYAPTRIIGLEFNWIKMPYDYVAVLQGVFEDNPDINGECYWVKVLRNGQMYMWGETDDRSAHDGTLTYLRLTSRRDIDEEEENEVLVEGDVVSVSVSRISRQMYEYLEALGNGSNGPAMFSGDRCLGYFMATSPVSDSVVFHPDDIPEYRLRRPATNRIGETQRSITINTDYRNM